MRKTFQPIDDETERIAKLIVDSAYKVHIKLGSGLLEKVYEVCFCYELEKHGLHYQRQVNIPIVYDVMRSVQESIEQHTLFGV